ncbi:MAG: methylated-DNA--[protein]-cysteine S-methyltransferase [Gammaproteobacteria bacterium]|nr:MAG: methylated-DNA--[protein]-cysteine S-methyltransferase [Gammaproteobacteria bacterium]
MYYSYVDSPIGPLLLAGDGEALSVVGFSRGKKSRVAEPDWERRDEAFGRARLELAEYFDGKRQRFDVALLPEGTEFQLAVWSALRDIPYGATRSYREIAEQIGKPTAIRAVGAANGSNPLPIVVPCHRVIGADGSLTGFGGGIETKRFLLELERSRSGLFAASSC